MTTADTNASGILARGMLRARIAQVLHLGGDIYRLTDTVHCESCESTTVDVLAGVPILRVRRRWGLGGVDWTAWCANCWQRRPWTRHTWVAWLPSEDRAGTWRDLEPFLCESWPECWRCGGQDGVVEYVLDDGALDAWQTCGKCTEVISSDGPGDFRSWVHPGPCYTDADLLAAMDVVRAEPSLWRQFPSPSPPVVPLPPRRTSRDRRR